jgi:hypothetical protein
MAWRGDRTYPRGRASASNFNARHWICLPMWDYVGRHDDELPVRYVSLEEIRARRAGDAAPSPSSPPRAAGFRVHLSCGGAIIADATGWPLCRRCFRVVVGLRSPAPPAPILASVLLHIPRWFHAATILAVVGDKARLDLEVRRDSLSGRMLGPDAETVDSHCGDQNGDEGPDNRAQGCPFSDG